MGSDISKKNSYELEVSKSSGIKIRKSLKNDKSAVGVLQQDNIKTKRTNCWKCGISTLIFSFIINLFITILMWFTNTYSDYFHGFVTLREDGMIFKLWSDSGVPRIISVYPFNYTNVKAIKAGIEVPHVQELGPYVFREKVTKVNIKFNENGTVTYQENRTHEFAPELSKGSLTDIIVIPNFPVLAAHNIEDAGMLERSGVSFLKLATWPSDFLKLSVKEVIWGYDDRFTKVSSVIQNMFKRKSKVERKFGVLTMRNGLSEDRITIGSGVPDVDNFTLITRYNGKSTYDAWQDEQCDKIQGTDGSTFPYRLIVPNTTLQVFSKEMCRNVPLVFEKELITKDGMPAYRYRMPGDVFECAEKNPANTCFCKKSGCPPCGTFNSAACNLRLPVLMSYPHFTHADPELRKKVTGLTPDPDKYQTLADINSYGITVHGYSQLQINFFLSQSSNTPWLNLTDGTVLPLAWLQLKNGEFSDYILKIMYHLSFTLPRIEAILSYSSLFIVLTFPFFIYYLLRTGKGGDVNFQ